MTSIDELRSTLDRHASAVADPDLAGRASSVHARVGVVRRRRRAAAAGGLAVVVAVAGGIALLPGGTDQARPEPAATVVGLTPPDQLVATGFTYAFAQGVDGVDGKATVKLEASPEPRLVSWATSGGDDRVTVDGPTLEGPVDFDDADFGNWLLVPAGSPSTVKARVRDGEPGLAVYTLTADRPSGLTKAGVTFREQVAGSELLGAAIGDAGQPDVSFAATATGRGIDVKYFCSGVASNAYLHIAIGDPGEGEVVSGRGCGEGLPVDPASSGGSGLPTTPGEDISTRLYVTQGPKGPLVDDPGMRIGIGTYARAEGSKAVGLDGFFPTEREEGGHAWRLLERTTVGQQGDQQVSATAPTGRGAVLAVTGIRLRSDGYASLDWDGNESSSVLGGVQSESTWAVVAAGGTVTLDLTGRDVYSGGDQPVGAMGRGDRVDIAFYVRRD